MSLTRLVVPRQFARDSGCLLLLSCDIRATARPATSDWSNYYPRNQLTLGGSNSYRTRRGRGDALGVEDLQTLVSPKRCRLTTDLAYASAFPGTIAG